MRQDVLTQMEQNLDQFGDSDFTMIATTEFNKVIDLVQSSCLNFQLKLSPFSATISLKKSLIKNKSGTFMVPMPPKTGTFCDDDINLLVQQKKKLSAELCEMRKKYDGCLLAYTVACENIKTLQSQLDDYQLKVKVGEKVTLSEEENIDREKELMDLKGALKEKDVRIDILQCNLHTIQEVANKLNIEVNSLKVCHDEEKHVMDKEHKDQMEKLKNDFSKLMNENKKMRGKKPLQNSPERDYEKTLTEINSSNESSLALTDASSPVIDAESVTDTINYPLTRKGFSFRLYRTEKLPSLSKKNMHSGFGILREPYPPPLPTLTPLVNKSSDYHNKVLDGTLDWGLTCENCYGIDCKNYGCPKCVWMKWYGELHGYPDLDPSIYEEYLS